MLNGMQTTSKTTLCTRQMQFLIKVICIINASYQHNNECPTITCQHNECPTVIRHLDKANFGMTTGEMIIRAP